MKYFSLLLVALFFALSSQQCGPPECYPDSCSDFQIEIDFVFVIDVSGSMSEEINGVKNGLTSFAQGLVNAGIDAKFAIVEFARENQPSRKINLSGFSTFKNAMNQISLNGYWEAGLEAIRCVFNRCNSNYHLNISWRSTAKKVVFLLTDEDSDPAIHDNTYQYWNDRSYCRSTGDSDWYYYQNEIDATAQIVMDHDASLYMLVHNSDSGSSRCMTFEQYGDPSKQSQNGDFSNFNAQATLNNMNGHRSRNSMQGKLLEAGKFSRVFDVMQANNPNFINNFFESVTKDVSSCDFTCTEYKCSGTTCLPEKNICGCDGNPFSTAVEDCAGVCQGTATEDCAGVCQGTNGYNQCGVCNSNPSGENFCKTDCDGNKYLDPALEGSSQVWQTNCDAAALLAANAQFRSSFAPSTTETTFCDWYTATGVFTVHTQCSFDYDYYKSQNLFSGSNAAVEADYLANLNKAARCVSGTSKQIPYQSDNCGQCYNPLEPLTCTLDCRNQYVPQGSPVHVFDNCNICVAPTADMDGNKDDCGICQGGNAAKNECGVCFGVTGKDACDQNLCEGLFCGTDCDGNSVSEITKQVDECGNCVLISNVRDPNCVTDCNGVYYQNGVDTPESSLDDCGTCTVGGVRTASCVDDCAGTPGGSAYYDSCGQCIDGVDDVECLTDCEGTFYLSTSTPPKSLDDCNQCNAPANMNELKDLCGVCTNSINYDAAQCVQDCKGDYKLLTDETRARVDYCGECWTAAEWPVESNQKVDDCGICWLPQGSADPNWNQDIKTDTQGNKCPCGVDPEDCGDGITTCADGDCPTSDPCPGYPGVQPDDCLHCPDHVMYNKTDTCGLCCDDPSEGGDCDQDVDSCGVCFGFDQSKNTNVCGLCNADDCVTDCLGTPNGTAVYDCDGVCGGTNFACSTSSCGNGIVEEGEDCDEGALNGQSSCLSDCTTAETDNTGAIIGGVVGGLAGVLCVGASAFLLYQYAEKSGFLGKVETGNQLENNANQNPLYSGQTQIHSNPIFENGNQVN